MGSQMRAVCSNIWQYAGMVMGGASGSVGANRPLGASLRTSKSMLLFFLLSIWLLGQHVVAWGPDPPSFFIAFVSDY